MLQIELHKKFKLNLSRVEIESVLRMLLWYIYTREIPCRSIIELANIQRAIKLGQRLENRLFSMEKSKCKLTLNIQEASTIYSIMELLSSSELGALDQVVVMKVNDMIYRGV
ncbi:hypothetical protein QYZ87_04830 [Porphyromonadaceae bacterium W3.11]|nr:hypothetical protein [Porphyromonadaceae bacterium W3.11]